MHPSGKFHKGSTEPGVWLEVSVCGKLFSLRGSRSAQIKGAMVCFFYHCQFSVMIIYLMMKMGYSF